jgi:FMN phosphatase YigB (HAD superfamily)
MIKTLALDFDGVVFRNHRANTLVATKCQNYLAHNLGRSVRNPLKIREINQHLYRSYGHTVLGMRKIGIDVDLHEFNRYVYDSIPYNTLFHDLQETHSRDISSFTQLLDHCKSNNIRVQIFSNAPDTWCFTIMHHMGIDMDKYIDGSFGIITSEHLKPTTECFYRVRSCIGNDSEVTFVDDTFLNFKHTLDLENWRNVLMSPEIQIDVLDITPKLTMIHEIKQLYKVPTSNMSIV